MDVRDAEALPVVKLVALSNCVSFDSRRAAPRRRRNTHRLAAQTFAWPQHPPSWPLQACLLATVTARLWSVLFSSISESSPARYCNTPDISADRQTGDRQTHLGSKHLQHLARSARSIDIDALQWVVLEIASLEVSIMGGTRAWQSFLHK